MRWIIAVLIAFSSTNVAAQAPDSRGYVFGGATATREEGAVTNEHRTYLEAPGGWAGGVFLGGGVRVGPISIESEWRRTGVMETIEPSRYFITYSAQRRDTSLGVGARAHVPISRRVTLEPVGLFEFVHEASWLAQRTDVTPATSADFGEHTPYVDSWGTGLVGGIDVRIGERHFAVVPGFRARRFWRDATGGVSSAWPGGVSNWGVEASAGVRVDF